MRRRMLFLVFVAAIVGANALAFRSGATADLTPNRRLTLQPESVRVARRLPRGTSVRVFLPPRSRFGREAKLLLERYALEARGLRFSFVDPTTRPGELLSEGVAGGHVVVSAPGRRIVADGTSEQDLTSAFLHVISPKASTVCFTSGHGERAIDDEGPSGLSGIGSVMRRAGYELATMPPGTFSASGCDVVVVAGPRTGFAPAEADAFARYLGAEGKALVTADPPGQDAAGALTAEWGVKVLPGIVVDPVQSFQRDPLSPVVDRYPSFSPVVAELREATIWPESAGLEGGGLVEGRGGLYVSTLAETSAASWLEAGGGPGLQDGTDRRGPLLVAASADYSRVGERERRVTSERPRVIRARLLVLGGTNVAANAFVGFLGNSRLVLDGVAWLAQSEELIGLVPKPVSPAGLVLTSSRRRALLWWSIGFPVALAAGAGAAAWALRR